MTYTVKEIFHTLQGEGGNIGSPAVFIRFAGCNLWSGREHDRATATCQFCDTDFIGGKRYAAEELADAAAALWPGDKNRLVVLTGGEPALQVDRPLVHELKRRGFRVAIETNGSIDLPPMGIDWTCVSPKAGAPLRVTVAEEVKLVFPQAGLMPDALPAMRSLHRWLSPMDGPAIEDNIRKAAAYCLAHTEWRLTIQAHKVWGIR
ncbi:7-carboxy-7-deazaguanine synthase [Rhodopila sp.]|uniref:7-carboxy-7-deazaguanine synthase n=1 Tax=Rhodopila sp. TaxID=2480087 RepID=UPI003D13A032